jgi:hypothetical protein
MTESKAAQSLWHNHSPFAEMQTAYGLVTIAFFEKPLLMIF